MHSADKCKHTLSSHNRHRHHFHRKLENKGLEARVGDRKWVSGVVVMGATEYIHANWNLVLL